MLSRPRFIQKEITCYPWNLRSRVKFHGTKPSRFFSKSHQTHDCKPDDGFGDAWLALTADQVPRITEGKTLTAAEKVKCVVAMTLGNKCRGVA